MFTTRRAQQKDGGTQMTQIILKSIISDHPLLSNTHWALSLVRKKGTEHACLVLEGLKGGEYFIFRSDLFLDASKREATVKSLPSYIAKPIDALWQFSESSSGSAFIRLKEINVEELEAMAKESEYQSYGITTDQAEKLIQRLIQEADKPIIYNIAGNHSIFSPSYSGSEYHNCVSWCTKILNDELQIKIADKWDITQRPSEMVKRAIEQAKASQQSTPHVSY